MEWKKLKMPKDVAYDPFHIPMAYKDRNRCGYYMLISKRGVGKTTSIVLIGMILFKLYGCRTQYLRQTEEMTTPKNSNKLMETILSCHYIDTITDFCNQYGSYLSYVGLDYTQPLDTQVCTFSETPMTWQQYFLSSALANWHNYAALAEEGELNGFEMDQEYADMIQKLPESLATDAGVQGFGSAEEYLAYNVGAGATIADYQSYMNTYYQGFTYFRSCYDEMVPTDEEIETALKRLPKV